MKKITSLTPEQEILMKEWRRECLEDIGRCTEPADFELAKKVLTDFYNRVGIPTPKFYECKSPLHAQKMIHTLKNGDKGKMEVHGTWMWGSWDISWVAYFTFIDRFVRKIHTPEQRELLLQWERLSRSCGWIYSFRGHCFICDRPREIHVNERGLLHNPNGPAMRFEDGLSLWFYKGIKVPKEVILDPTSLTVEMIEQEKNMEVKRVFIDIFGYDRYIMECGATLVSEDEYGKLWKKQLNPEETVLVVELTNSTPEDDGTFKKYFLPCHPELRPIMGKDANGNTIYGDPQKCMTPHAAVAASFGKYAHEYNPGIQT